MNREDPSKAVSGGAEKLAVDSGDSQRQADRRKLERLIQRALRALQRQLEEPGAHLKSPVLVAQYLTLRLAGLEHEMFAALWLDAQHRVITYEELFRGTLTQTSVYPREIVKAALRHNAAAVIFAHNHPSGVAEPSHADELLTLSLRTSLEMVDVKLLDHIIIAGTTALSFAQRGLL